MERCDWSDVLIDLFVDFGGIKRTLDSQAPQVSQTQVNRGFICRLTFFVNINFRHMYWEKSFDSVFRYYWKLTLHKINTISKIRVFKKLN